MSLPMSAIGKPTTAAKDVLNLLQTFKELRSTENEEVVCHVLRHYIARVKELSDRREQRMQMMKGPDGLQSDTEPNFSSSAEYDFEAAFENVQPELLQTSVQDRELDNESCKPDPDSGAVRYFEIMSFKTIPEDDCESEANYDMSTAFETVHSNSTDSIHADSPRGAQDWPDMLGMESEDNLSPKQADAFRLQKDRCDKGMLLVKTGTVEEKTKASVLAGSKKLFEKRMHGPVCKRDNYTDVFDVMGMAIL